MDKRAQLAQAAANGKISERPGFSETIGGTMFYH